MSSGKKFVAIRFMQGVGTSSGQEMYLLSAPTRWLVRNTRIDRWDPESDSQNWEEQGYQRALSESHLKAIERYLKGAHRRSTHTQMLPVFPTSVLLAVRQAPKFEPFEGSDLQQLGGDLWVKLGVLVLPEDDSLFIIDGQHRLKGLERVLEDPDYEDFGNYYLPVTVMVCEDKLDELIHFMTINKEAKSVRTDLAQRLLEIVRTQNPERIYDKNIRDRADRHAEPLAVVRYLEDTPDQPWYGRIAKPNERRGGNRVASEGQLARSLRHIRENRPLDWDTQKVKEFVRDFWIVLSELLPEAFEDPKGYTIQKGVGFGPLHRLLPNMTSYYEDRDSLRETLEGVEPFFTDAEYWKRGGEASSYSSEGAYKDHAEKIKAALSDKLSA